MKLELDNVTSDGQSLEGITIEGEKIRARGKLVLPYFSGTITEGPKNLLSFPCDVLIDDMTAHMTVTPKVFTFTGAQVFS